MGRKKRNRLKNRLQQSSPPLPKLAVPPGHTVITVAEYASMCYELYGRGIVSYCPSSPPRYVSPTHSSVESLMLKRYDPITQVVIERPAYPDNSGLWETSIESRSSRLASLRIIFPAGQHDQLLKEAVLA